MRALALKKTKALVVLVAMTAVYTVTAATSASAVPITIDLCAKDGSTTLPGVGSVPVWGFALKGAAADCSDVTATVPGPVLEVNLGDDVTINVTSALPAGASAASFESPGLDVSSPSAGTFAFHAGRVGTFEYQSSSDAGRQMAMGLSGALIVRPASEPAGFATGSCSTAAGVAYGTAFARECMLVMSAIDPAFNAAPLTFDLNDYEATYWLLNGTVYPNTPAIVAPASTTLLLRYVNTGYDNSAMSLLGLHEHVLARDAFPVPNPYDAVSEIIAAGATEDAVLTMPSYAPPGANGFPLFNRNLHLQNGSSGNATTPPTGGMLVFIHS